MKKGLAIIAILLMLFAVLSPLTAKGADEKKDQLTVGVVIPYQIGWFAAFHQGFSLVAEAENVKLVWQFHEYSPDKEANASKPVGIGVDAST